MSDMSVLDILRTCFPEVQGNDSVAYLGEAGYAVDALLYGNLYWPELLELYGAVFLALDGDDERDISRRLATPVGDGHPEWSEMSWNEAVNSFNTFEVEHLFGNWRGAKGIYRDVHRELGRILVKVWSARLVSAFPDRQFSVVLLEPDGSTGWRIEVGQQSPALSPPDGWDPRRRGIITALVPEPEQ